MVGTQRVNQCTKANRVVEAVDRGTIADVNDRTRAILRLSRQRRANGSKGSGEVCVAERKTFSESLDCKCRTAGGAKTLAHIR